MVAKDLIVVIASIGRSELLRRTILSLEACRKPDIFRGIIVVENGRKGGVENIVHSCSRTLNARYIYLSEPGQSRAKNRGIEVAAQEVDGNALVFFTDDDVRLHVNTLCSYAEATIASDGGEFYGGPVRVDYQVEPPAWLKAYLPPSARGWQLEGGLQSYNKPAFLGCNWAAFVKDIINTGGFDHNFGFGGTSGGTGEETQIQDRLLKRGIKGTYVPDAIVWHYVPIERCSPKWAIKRAYLYGIEAGLHDVSDGHTVLGISATMLLRWARFGLEILRESLSGNTEAAFRSRYSFRHFCGYMRGSQLAKKISAKTINNS